MSFIQKVYTTFKKYLQHSKKVFGNIQKVFTFKKYLKHARFLN